MYKTWISFAALVTMAAYTTLPAAQPERRTTVEGARWQAFRSASTRIIRKAW